MNDFKTAYAEKLKDPRWQKKRLEVLQRDEFKCCICKDSDKTLHVHHIEYKKGRAPWDYDIDMLETLCHICHGILHANKDELWRDDYESYMDMLLKETSEWHSQMIRNLVGTALKVIKTDS